MQCACRWSSSARLFDGFAFSSVTQWPMPNFGSFIPFCNFVRCSSLIVPLTLSLSLSHFSFSIATVFAYFGIHAPRCVHIQSSVYNTFSVAVTELCAIEKSVKNLLAWRNEVCAFFLSLSTNSKNRPETERAREQREREQNKMFVFHADLIQSNSWVIMCVGCE